MANQISEDKERIRKFLKQAIKAGDPCETMHPDLTDPVLKPLENLDGLVDIAPKIRAKTQRESVDIALFTHPAKYTGTTL